MKKITKKELAVFFDSINTSDPPDNYDATPAFHGFFKIDKKLVNRLANGFRDATFRGMLQNGDPTAGILSIFVTGFQMGREFEGQLREGAELNALLGNNKPRSRKIPPEAKTQ